MRRANSLVGLHELEDLLLPSIDLHKRVLGNRLVLTHRQLVLHHELLLHILRKAMVRHLLLNYHEVLAFVVRDFLASAQQLVNVVLESLELINLADLLLDSGFNVRPIANVEVNVILDVVCKDVA